MTPDFATPFLQAFSTFASLVVAVGIAGVFAAIVIGVWSLINTPGERR